MRFLFCCALLANCAEKIGIANAFGGNIDSSEANELGCGRCCSANIETADRAAPSFMLRGMKLVRDQLDRDCRLSFRTVTASSAD